MSSGASTGRFAAEPGASPSAVVGDDSGEEEWEVEGIRVVSGRITKHRG